MSEVAVKVNGGSQKPASSVAKTNKLAKSISNEISNVVLGKEQTIEMYVFHMHYAKSPGSYRAPRSS